jgi:microcystin-dependent protein
MTKLSLTYDIKNYTPASATSVDSNFDAIEQHINQELIERDGSVQMRAQLALVGDPVNALDAAPKQYGKATAPPGGRWLLCDGSELQTASYPELYNEIGHNFSPAGTPGSRFNLPNLRDRMPMGMGTNTTMGETGGFRNNSLVEHHHGMASHTHAMKNHTHGMGQHTHKMDHDHDDVDTSTIADHTHTFSLRTAAGSSGGATIGGVSQSGNGTTGADGGHKHTVNTPKFFGNTDPPGNNVTGPPDDNITYGPDDNNTSDEGIPSTDRNLPPFQGVQFIIRAK